MLIRLFLGVLLFISSAGTIQKYVGTPAAVVSLPVLLIVSVAVLPRLEREATRFSNRQALVVGSAGLILLIIALVVVYPHANAHTLGAGSDRDDAANIGARRLLAGEYPYGPLTYLGNPISQLPGALALDAPFVSVFGSSAYANVFWIAVLAALVALVVGSLPVGVTVVSAGIVLSPGVLREFVTGGDLIANAVYIAAASLAIYRLAGHRYAGPLAALALGLTLASRGNFVLLLIPLGVALMRRHGLRRALALTTVSVLTALSLVAVPLSRASGRQSLRAADHLSALGRIGATTTLAVAVIIAIALAVRTRHWAGGVILGQAALVQALFPIALVVHASASAARLDFSPLVTGYGVPALLLALPSVVWLSSARSSIDAQRR